MRNPFKAWWRWVFERAAFYHPVRAEVLIVEDVDSEAELLSTLLRNQRAVTTRVRNVAGALEVLNGPNRFQVAFVDLGLPDGSGSEVVRLIRDRRRGTHVVLVSGDPEKVMLALGHGLVTVMMKPYAVNTVREVLTMMRLPHSD